MLKLTATVFTLLSVTQGFAQSQSITLQELTLKNPDVEFVMNPSAVSEKSEVPFRAIDLVRQDLANRGLSKSSKRGVVIMDNHGCQNGQYNVAILAADGIQSSQKRDDLVKHSIAGSVIALGAAVATEKMICKELNAEMSSYVARTVGFLVACSAGVGKEAYDKFSGRGTPDTRDAVVTCLGGAVAFVPVIDIRF
jgi:hypothetical protein